jgi:hypothetical protein
MNEIQHGRGARSDALKLPRRDFLIVGSAAAVGAFAGSALAAPADGTAGDSSLSFAFAEASLDEILTAKTPHSLTSANRLGDSNRLGTTARVKVHGIVRAENSRRGNVELDAVYRLGVDQPVHFHAWSDRDAVRIGNAAGSPFLVGVSSAPLTLALIARAVPSWRTSMANRFFGTPLPETTRAKATLVRDGVYFLAVPADGQPEPNWSSIRVVASADAKLPQLEQSTLFGSRPVSFDYIVVGTERA